MMKLQPKLRFKEFSGDWEEKKLGEVANFKNGKGHEKSINENGDYIVVNSKFISSNGIVKKYVEQQIIPLYKNDLVMVMSDVPNGKAIAKCFLINENDRYSLNQRICCLSSENNSIQFIYYSINRNKYYLKFDDGVKQTNLRKDEVLKCPVPLPCLDEQEKVASFLSSVDEKIEKLEGKKEKLAEYKKGIMQKVFSQEIRFKNENNQSFPDWEEKKLGEITNFHKQGYYTKEKYSNDNPYYLFSGSNIKNHRIDLLSCPKINASEEDFNSFKIEKGDVLLIRSGNVGGYAIAYENQNVIFGSYIIKFNFDKENISNEFFGYFYQSEEKERQLKTIVQTSANININAENIKSLKINLPCLEEQEKIAEFLSSVDEKIDKAGEEVDRMKEFKKGLLQGMFV